MDMENENEVISDQQAFAILRELHEQIQSMYVRHSYDETAVRDEIVYIEPSSTRYSGAIDFAALGARV